MLIGRGPRTRRNVSGDMVPAPTSTSYGCWRMHPRSAQKVCRRKSSCWKVRGSVRVGIEEAEMVADTFSFSVDGTLLEFYRGQGRRADNRPYPPSLTKAATEWSLRSRWRSRA